MSAPDQAPPTLRAAQDDASPRTPSARSYAPEERAREIRYHHSPQFRHVLEDSHCSLLVSTYQAGQLVALGVADGQLVLTFRELDHAMGIAVGANRVAVGGKGQIWLLRDHSELAAQIPPAGRYDRCWLPRSSRVTGGIQGHEIAWGTTASGEPDLWIVNTLFSCLCGLDPRYNFVPRWQPPFISALAPQDRCHLNGLAIRDGLPAFVTVLAATDEPGGWRTAHNHSGALLDVASGEAVSTGLAMPHSPRWHRGELFVLNSGLGRLERVDPATGQREAVASVPGFARGLAFHDDIAFVGLSKGRETAIFGRAPIAAYSDELKCGIGVIDLNTGRTLATLQFATGVEEIFDVQTVSGARCPTFGGSPGDGDEVWLLPAQLHALAPASSPTEPSRARPSTGQRSS